MDLKTNAINGLKGAQGMILKDLEALPEDAFTKAFGPKVRTVADIVFEVNMVNDYIGMAMRGEDEPEWPDNGWVKAPEGFSAKADVIEAFRASTQKIIDTVEGYSQEDLEGTIETEHGPRSRYQRCNFMTLHMWYHMGQFNYVQTLLGDDGWHWG